SGQEAGRRISCPCVTPLPPFPARESCPMTLLTRRLVVSFLVLLSLFLLGLPAGVQGEPPIQRTVAADKQPDVVLHRVSRGDVTVTVEERGVIESMQNTTVTCRLRSPTGATAASTIRWLIDDGSQVKKVDKLVEVDDSALRDQIRAQEVIVAGKKADVEQAVKTRDLAEEKGKLEVGTAEDNLEIAEIELKQAEEKDKRKLEARLRQAKRALQLAKLQAATARAQGDAATAAGNAALDADQARLGELKEQLALWVLAAPRDGSAVSTVPEQARWGIGRSGTVAVGEPVREGQVLMTLPD